MCSCNKNKLSIETFGSGLREEEIETFRENLRDTSKDTTSLSTGIIVVIVVLFVILFVVSFFIIKSTYFPSTYNKWKTNIPYTPSSPIRRFGEID